MEKKIRNQIKKIIKERENMTQDEFADSIGLDRNIVNQILNGKNELTGRQLLILNALNLKTGLLDANEKGKYELSENENKKAMNLSKK